jgi:hypothetical protein
MAVRLSGLRLVARARSDSSKVSSLRCLNIWLSPSCLIVCSTTSAVSLAKLVEVEGWVLGFHFGEPFLHPIFEGVDVVGHIRGV